ncbi:hypothetical protein PINS_up006215 [Pythium insidiosum]|nr:hypothetical protein PINS_up006215 [Pythium insidiosum]
MHLVICNSGVYCLQFLGQREAQRFDERLMSSEFGFSIDQLMELAGLSVACAIQKEFSAYRDGSASAKRKVLVVAGPGNNGGDALVAARHLQHFGFASSVLYPKQSSKPLFQGLVTQCKVLDIPFVEAPNEPATIDSEYDLVLDGIFGFSFEGAIRPPFDSIISTVKKSKCPIVSIDIPSGWHVEQGNASGLGLEPQMLVSLTAPKLCAQFFGGSGKIHYVGGRFVPPSLAKEFNLDLPVYSGSEQCVRIDK